MRIPRGTMVAAVAALLALSLAGEARAQATPYELNLHVGGLGLEDADDTDVLLGARFMLQYPSGWGWGGNFDWAQLEERGGFFGEDVDFDLYLYSFEVDHTFARGSRVRPFVGGGIGAATFRVSDLPDSSGDDESETHVLVPLAGGVKWFDRVSQPRWAIRGEIRDNIIFPGDDSFFFRDDEATNNWEFSGGVSFFF